MMGEFSCSWKVSSDIDYVRPQFRKGFVAFQKGRREGDVVLRLCHDIYRNTADKYQKGLTYNVS
jgi:hypothetical protein